MKVVATFTELEESHAAFDVQCDDGVTGTPEFVCLLSQM